MKRGACINHYCCLFTLLIALAAVRARADQMVSVSVDGFSPSSVTIAPAEAVIWVVEDDQGPYTISSPIGAWSPLYLYDAGDMTGLRFNQVGDYDYLDAMNGNYGVVHVRVGVPNTPPSVSITSPADGAVFNAPATFSFVCDASDPDDGLMDVEFYVGADLVDDIYTSPFSTTVTNLAAGTYTLTAVAYDFGGAETTSLINITVQGGSGSVITLGVPSLSGGQFRLDVTGLTSGKQVVLQSCSSLAATANWTSLQTNTSTGASTSLTTPAVAGTHFFRILQLP